MRHVPPFLATIEAIDHRCSLPHPMLLWFSRIVMLASNKKDDRRATRQCVMLWIP